VAPIVGRAGAMERPAFGATVFVAAGNRAGAAETARRIASVTP